MAPGQCVRDWLHLEDHRKAIWLILSEGEPGEACNTGHECKKPNIEVDKGNLRYLLKERIW